jgi:hypothetical protein
MGRHALEFNSRKAHLGILNMYCIVLYCNTTATELGLVLNTAQSACTEPWLCCG